MMRSVPIYITLAGFLLLLTGFVCIWYAFPLLEEYMLRKNTRLLPGNEAYKAWEKLPFPLKFKIHIFNVTNPQEVHDGGLPIFRELGPYVYDEHRSKKVIKMKEENDTVVYMAQRIFFFNKEESMCYSDEDVVTIINAGLMTTAVMVENMAPMALPMINDAIPYLFPDQKTIFMTGKVKDILFNGMKMDCQSEEVEMICGAVKARMPPTLRVADNNRDYLAAMFHHINGTWDGPFEITRGSHKTRRGQIISYRNESSIDKWGSKFCNMLNGTDLSVLPLLTKEDQVLFYFIEDFCRSFHGKFESEVEYEGLHGYKYTSEIPFQEDPGDGCFCTKNKQDNPEQVVCTPSGTMNIAPCVMAPIVMSYPHFYLADTDLLKTVRGLDPQKEKHMTYIIGEPKTGTSLSLRIRLQMNIYLRKVDGIDILQNVSTTLFPIIWLEEAEDLSTDMLNYLKDQLGMLGYLRIIEWVFIVSGLLVLSIACVVNMYDDKMLCFARQQHRVQAAKSTAPTTLKDGTLRTIAYPSTMYPANLDRSAEKDSNILWFRRGGHNHDN